MMRRATGTVPASGGAQQTRHSAAEVVKPRSRANAVAGQRFSRSGKCRIRTHDLKILADLVDPIEIQNQVLSIGRRRTYDLHGIERTAPGAMPFGMVSYKG